MKKRNETFAHAIVGFFMVALVALLSYFTIVVSGVDRRQVRVADVGKVAADPEKRREPIEDEDGGAKGKIGRGGEFRFGFLLGEFAEPGDEELAAAVAGGEHLHQHPLARHVKPGLLAQIAQDRAERPALGGGAVGVPFRYVPVHIALQKDHLDF